MKKINNIILIAEEEYLISIAETQDIQEPTLLEDLACFEY